MVVSCEERLMHREKNFELGANRDTLLDGSVSLCSQDIRKPYRVVNFETPCIFMKRLWKEFKSHGFKDHLKD